MTDHPAVVIGVDVGTQSARAGVFTPTGSLLGRGEQPLRIWHPHPDHVEQSSRDIWDAVGLAVREARRAAGVPATAVVGLGFTATCSLVAVGADGGPVAVNAEGDDTRDVIVWMDHRAVEDAQAINDTGHPVLAFVGGVVSPEMQTPKLRWVKREVPDSWARAAHWFDLADYLTWRATGSDVRSLCTTVCKWTYLGHEQRWDPSFFDAIDLEELPENNFERIGSRVWPPGEGLGSLTSAAATDLDLNPSTAVATSLIDAHAGALGVIGAPGRDASVDGRLALIAGTSACHLAVSIGRHDVPGVWGPYWGALLPGYWLLEAGLSASGAFLDLLVASHPAGAELGTDGFGALDAVLRRIAVDGPSVTSLTRDVHLQPSVLGNRAPLAAPELRGGLAGWTLRDDIEDLAVRFLAGVQALAYATRHIVETMRDRGVVIDEVVTAGGSATNEWWLRTHADVLGLPIALPVEPDAVLLGAAMLGATASGLHASLEVTMSEMTRLARVIEPDPAMTDFHDAKYRVYRRMLEDQIAYQSIMHDY